jgi:hypothetical protein
MAAHEYLVKPDLVMVDRELPIPEFSFNMEDSFEIILSVWNPGDLVGEQFKIVLSYDYSAESGLTAAAAEYFLSPKNRLLLR